MPRRKFLFVNQDELLPCPFCGYDASLEQRVHDEANQGYDMEIRIICSNYDCVCRPASRWHRVFLFDSRDMNDDPNYMPDIREDEQKRLQKRWNRRKFNGNDSRTETVTREELIRAREETFRGTVGSYDFFDEQPIEDYGIPEEDEIGYIPDPRGYSPILHNPSVRVTPVHANEQAELQSNTRPVCRNQGYCDSGGDESFGSN